MSEIITWNILYEGALLSSNELRSQSRHKYKDKIAGMKAEFRSLIRKAKVQEMGEFSVVLEYNTHHDADNLSATFKYFQDTLKKEKLIKDDSPKFSKGMTIKYNKDLKKGQLLFKIHKHG